MKLRISINGVDYAAYNLTSLEGTLNVLMKPAAYKKVRSNENASIHGTHMLTAPTARRKAAGTISIPFLITGASSLKDLQRKIDKLVEVLVNGKNNIVHVTLKKVWNIAICVVDCANHFTKVI